MRTVRSTQSQQVSIENCPHCGSGHEFELSAVIDEVVGVMHMMKIETVVRQCSVMCPEKGLPIIVGVPVTLYSGQTLVDVR